MSAARVERLAAAIAERELDSMIVGDLVRPGDSSREAMADVIWLTGFRGSSGLAVVGPSSGRFLTDFRYAEMAASGAGHSLEIELAEGEILVALAGMLSGRVGFDEGSTSVRALRRLQEEIDSGVELVPVEGLLGRLRRVKDADEIEAIAAAAALTDEVYAEIEERGLGGRTELEVAVWTESRMRELGAEGPSFSPIVAAGPNGSRPHAEPGPYEIGPNEMVTIDMGAILDGYCSDCTRTYATGELDDEQREAYELVERAQGAALGAIRSGVGGQEADAVARDVITEGGRGEQFGHGLGHGVGVEVHEAPRLSKRSDDVIAAGEAVTVEPGVYEPGRFGIRIEDLVIVTDDGHRNLCSRPKALTVVG